MPNAALAIEHLRVDFPEIIAVNDLSLTIEAGDKARISVGLIRAERRQSKTTTMRAVSGLQRMHTRLGEGERV